jgi:hypothetical protein
MPRKKKISMVQPLLLTVPDVAIQLSVCRATVYNLMAYDGLPYILLRGVRRVHPDSLGEWLRRFEQVA